MAQFKIKKLKLQIDRIDVGTAAACTIRFSDPVAAPVHCTIEVQDDSRIDTGGLIVKDRGSVTGTYVDGRAVPEGGTPLADGSVIVLGVSKIEVKIKDGVIQLAPKERAFTYKKAGEKDGTMVPSDRDRWGLTEKGLGRLKSVWALNRLALLVVPVLIISLPISWEWLSDPGALTDPHRSLFADSGIAHASGADCSRKVCRSESQILGAQIAAEQGCESCHDPWGGTPTAKCYQCHQDLMDNQHPFPILHEKGDANDNVPASFDDHQCVLCHVEHRPSGSFFPALAKKEMRTKTVALCAECHDDLFPADEPEKPYSLARKRSSADPVFDVDRAYSTVAFPHSAHIALGPDEMNNCSWCHTPIDDAVRPDDTDKDGVARYREYVADPGNPDFHGVVRYERCQICHDANTVPSEVPGASEGMVALADTIRRDKGMYKEVEVVWKVDWHGTDDTEGFGNCQSCHIGRGDGIEYPERERSRDKIDGSALAMLGERLAKRAKALKHPTVDRPQFSDAKYIERRARYQYPGKKRRTHSHQFDDATMTTVDGKTCITCHRDGKALGTEQVKPVTFWHALHLSATPEQLRGLSEDGADPLLLESINGQCNECHTDRAEAKELVADGELFHWANQAACGECHTDGDTHKTGNWISMTSASTSAGIPSMAVSDFPHDRHLNIEGEGGCLQCHEFVSSGSVEPSDAYRTQIRTKAEARDCSSCHGKHQNIAGNACDRCHPQPIQGNRSDYNFFWGKAPADVLDQFGTLVARNPDDPDSVARPVRKWPRLNTFSHFSPGHAADANPKDGNCSACHTEGSWVSADGQVLTGRFRAAEAYAASAGQKDPLRFLPVPTEFVNLASGEDRQDSCRSCHLNLNKHRFHWR